MKLIPTSSDEFVGFNLLFVIFTLLLCVCLRTNIQAGSLLLSYGLGERLVQGKLEQIIQFPGEVGEIHKIGFTDEQGDKRHFYQYHRNRSVRALGSPLYFQITNEGIVLKNEVSGYVFIFSISLILTLVFSAFFGGVLIKVYTHRIECEACSKKIQYMLNLFKYALFVLSIVGVILAVNRVHTDFFLPEEKANVISVKCNNSFRYHVKAFSPSTKTEFDADWHFFNEVSPAIGQEVNICDSPNSKPLFARSPSDKVSSVVLLSIAFAYMSFTSVILIKGRVLCS